MSATLATPFFNHRDYPNNISNFRNTNTGLVNPGGGTPLLQNPHYNGYNSNNSNHNTTPDLRRAAAGTPRSLQQQSTPAQASTQPLSDMESSGGRSRKPNWSEFYKNGLPKEVIVIDDESPPPQPRQSSSTMMRNQAVSGPSTNGSVRHMDKKRKTAASTAYDPVYNKHYSTTQTPYHEGSGSTSISTDRTTSAYNTAATSLTSQASNGTWPAPAEQEVVGQKRKRQTTRKTTADKKRETDLLKDPYSCYLRGAPPNPPLKAQDVRVPVVPHRSYHSDKCDDDDGHYIVTPDTDLTDRYQIVKLLGQGTFGKVVEAYDKKKRTKCAVKIIRSVQKYRDASRIELRVLSTLASNDKGNVNKCIHLRDCFDFRNHICIVTDLLGQSVFDFLKGNQFVPFPSTHIQEFARQLFTSVAFLHDLNLIHTDLKPENILLVNAAYQTFTYNRTIPSSSSTSTRSARHRKVLLEPEIRLIDFGSATFDDEYHSSVVSTRHYRAPEIILNLGWSYPCDIWSIGCILVEFFTGDALFQTHDNLEHLAMMEPVCGYKLDKDLVRQVTHPTRGSHKNSAAQYFRKSLMLDYPNNETAKTSKKYVKAMKRLQDTIPPHTEFNRQFLDLLRLIFIYDPKRRITAKEALKHPWFHETLQDDGTEATRIKLTREARANQKQRSNYP
ncbi:kinase-like protein [Viridothelium virens]|uniref:dual-specificity kinase n=1 Tax=Viridothelium virens TaxID=1048519 RepID=A0A6A6GWH2_VIRVR|nr:kinase-like protein [Viridothelium virens]